MESLKEIAIDKAIDGLLNIIADTSKEEINQLAENNKLQRILYKTIVSFAKSPYFKNEFKDIQFSENKKSIFSISDEVINAANTPNQIASGIINVIKSCFPSDDDTKQNNISLHIALLYLQRAKVTLELYDIIRLQQEGFEQITDNLEDIKSIILSNHRYELNLRLEKETLLKKELKNEVTSIISEMMRNFLYLVTKEPPSFSASEMDKLGHSMVSRIENVLGNIEAYITQDFCTKPIRIAIINGLKERTEEINYLIFSECVFRKCILDGTQKLLNYKDIIDLETYVFILRLRNKAQSVLFMPLLEKGQTNILLALSFTIDAASLAFFQNELRELGKLIIALYHNLL